jgi:hypothetical protein
LPTPPPPPPLGHATVSLLELSRQSLSLSLERLLPLLGPSLSISRARSVSLSLANSLSLACALSPSRSCSLSLSHHPGPTHLNHTPETLKAKCRIHAWKVRSPFFRAKREQLEIFQGISPESQGQNQALTVSHVPYSLSSGPQTRKHKLEILQPKPRTTKRTVDYLLNCTTNLNLKPAS